MASKTGTARTTRRRLRSTDEPDPPEPVALSDALPRLASALDDIDQPLTPAIARRLRPRLLPRFRF